MKILVLRQPIGTVLGVSMRWYRPGHVYDLPATIAQYLVAEGFALIEMRSEQSFLRGVEHDRRKSPRPD